MRCLTPCRAALSIISYCWPTSNLRVPLLLWLYYFTPSLRRVYVCTRLRINHSNFDQPATPPRNRNDLIAFRDTQRNEAEKTLSRVHWVVVVRLPESTHRIVKTAFIGPIRCYPSYLKWLDNFQTTSERYESISLTLSFFFFNLVNSVD